MAGKKRKEITNDPRAPMDAALQDREEWVMDKSLMTFHPETLSGELPQGKTGLAVFRRRDGEMVMLPVSAQDYYERKGYQRVEVQ